MERNELSIERDKLLEIEGWFAQRQQREQQGDLIVFVSTDVLDRILARSEGLTVSVPDQGNVSLKFDAIKTTFRDGLPIVDVSATATKSGWPIQIGLTITALVDVEQILLYAPDTQVGLKVLKVVPSVSYGPLEFTLNNILLALLSAKPEIYSKALPKFTLPLEAAIPVNIPGSGITPEEAASYPDDVAALAVQYDFINIDLPSKWGTGILIKRPPVNRELVLNIQQVLALRNGLYVFAKTTLRAP